MCVHWPADVRVWCSSHVLLRLTPTKVAILFIEFLVVAVLRPFAFVLYLSTGNDSLVISSLLFQCTSAVLPLLYVIPFSPLVCHWALCGIFVQPVVVSSSTSNVFQQSGIC